MTETLNMDDYMVDSKGHLVPKSLVSEIDQERHALVNEILAAAKKLHLHLVDFKDAVMGDIQAFIDLSAEKYGATIGGDKGNVSLTSFDGKVKVQIAISDHFSFDERLQVSKALFDEWVAKVTEKASKEIKAIVNHAFQTDKEGKINVGRLMDLKRLEIDDELWLRAIEALTDAMHVVGSKTYLRVYERTGPDNKWSQVALDLAAI